jgi:transcriptional repressor NrdR
MRQALEKRPVASDAVDAAVAHVCHKLRTRGEREVPARLIGELVMDELHRLDEVAFVRFASVYRSFQDVEAFREEIERLRQRRPQSAEDLQLALWSGTDPSRSRE